MDNRFPPHGSTVPAEFISQATAPAAPKNGGGRLGNELADSALDADPSALGALTLLLQQIELHRLDKVICPDTLAHAKRVHDAGFQTCRVDQRQADHAVGIALCVSNIAKYQQQLAAITSHDRWEEKRKLQRLIDGYQKAIEVLRVTAQ